MLCLFDCRATCQQFAIAPGRTVDSVGGVPVLPGAAAAYVGGPRDQPVANHYCRNGASVPLHRAGAHDGHGRI